MILRIEVLCLHMLDDKMRGVLNRLIDRTMISFHTVMSSIRTDKADFHIQNESDYIGLAHGMILTGFMSDFKDQYKREPNQEMTEVSKVNFDRTNELREAILKSNK
jgi:hypothetical protein